MMMSGQGHRRLMVPGLFKAIVDEADSLMIDEAVTPLIISNSPEGQANAPLYKHADDLAQQLVLDRDFTIDWTVASAELTNRGKDRLDTLTVGPESSNFCAVMPARGDGPDRAHRSILLHQG